MTKIYKTLYIPNGEYLWYVCHSLEEAESQINAIIRMNWKFDWIKNNKYPQRCEFEIIYD